MRDDSIEVPAASQFALQVKVYDVRFGVSRGVMSLRSIGREVARVGLGYIVQTRIEQSDGGIEVLAFDAN